MLEVLLSLLRYYQLLTDWFVKQKISSLKGLSFFHIFLMHYTPQSASARPLHQLPIWCLCLSQSHFHSPVVFKSPVRSGFSAKFWCNRNRTSCLLSRFMGNRQPDRKKNRFFFSPNLFILHSVVTHKNVVKNLKICK